jgi:hypothetical protein
MMEVTPYLVQQVAEGKFVGLGCHLAGLVHAGLEQAFHVCHKVCIQLVPGTFEALLILQDCLAVFDCLGPCSCSCFSFCGFGVVYRTVTVMLAIASISSSSSVRGPC